MPDADKILPPDQYRPMLDMIRAGQVPATAAQALRDVNPDFARWMDAQPTPEAGPQKMEDGDDGPAR